MKQKSILFCGNTRKKLEVRKSDQMYSEWHNDQNDTAHIASRTDSLISAINSHFGKKE